MDTMLGRAAGSRVLLSTRSLSVPSAVFVGKALADGCRSVGIVC